MRDDAAPGPSTQALAPLSGSPRNRQISWGETAPGRLGREDARNLGRDTLVELLARVWCYVPVDDHGLGDLLPDRPGGDVAVVERPVAVAAGGVRLADHHQHGELGVLGGQEADERSPDVLRVLAVDGDL